MTAVPRTMLVPVLPQEEWWETVSQWVFDEGGFVLSGEEQEEYFHGEEIPCPRHGIILSECACITEYLVELSELTTVSLGTKDFILVDYAAVQELFGCETVSLLKKRIPMEGLR